MKKTIAILTFMILVLGCLNFTSCSKNISELSRVKNILEIEFSNSVPFISMEYTLTYYSSTFATVERSSRGGYVISGEIFYADQFGDKYCQNYTAFVGKDSWSPEIDKSEIKKL